MTARTAVPFLTPDDVEAMRAANRRFAAAVRSGEVDAAMTADDELHDVLVRVAANRAAAATIERYTPLIRRLERVRFGPASGRRSVAHHDSLIDACAGGDVVAAVRVTARIWESLEDLAR